ncbi:hypothetical protein [Chromobacterium haemolyticum]|uniref:hypothetical protein n=1 Tax=Chromobacterium haemolyticum TaxID=394935 RepID=UPI0013B41453|nr:hypothetical protein [Chromobacterium haemolyticum]
MSFDLFGVDHHSFCQIPVAATMYLINKKEKIVAQFIADQNFKTNHMRASVDNIEELKAIHRLRNVGKVFGAPGFVKFNTVFARVSSEGNFLVGLKDWGWAGSNPDTVVIPNTAVTTRAILNTHGVVEYQRCRRTNAVRLYARVVGRGVHATYTLYHLESAGENF